METYMLAVALAPTRVQTAMPFSMNIFEPMDYGVVVSHTSYPFSAMS
jgi:hypothetical protein